MEVEEVSSSGPYSICAVHQVPRVPWMRLRPTRDRGHYSMSLGLFRAPASAERHRQRSGDRVLVLKVLRALGTWERNTVSDRVTQICGGDAMLFSAGPYTSLSAISQFSGTHGKEPLPATGSWKPFRHRPAAFRFLTAPDLKSMQAIGNWHLTEIPQWLSIWPASTRVYY